MKSFIKVVLYRIQLEIFNVLLKLGIKRKRELIAKKGTIQKSFYGKEILAGEDGNNLCKEYLLNDQPCMLARIGTVEMGNIQAYLELRAGLRKKLSRSSVQLLCNNAGFFPVDEKQVCKFAEIYIEAVKEADVMGVFNNHAEDYFINEYAPSAKMVQFTTYESFYYSHPWTYALKGKRVLVIHPFEESIKKQYKKREQLFDNPEILPEFELITIKAVQTIGDNTAGFTNWFEALDYMKSKIKEVEFDVALIGCGAYAFPLAAFIKGMGKKAVVTAGATQLLFGIKGARWDRAETPVPYKDTWIRPNPLEVPEQSDTVENGCYW